MGCGCRRPAAELHLPAQLAHGRHHDFVREPGGGVGPHVDQYDVFLLQGIGQRHWAISTDPDAPKDFRPDVELKQLQHFEPTHEWLLEPGDMLYLPPGVPHDGIAFGGPCMTISVGMRAPSQAELRGPR